MPCRARCRRREIGPWAGSRSPTISNGCSPGCGAKSRKRPVRTTSINQFRRPVWPCATTSRAFISSERLAAAPAACSPTWATPSAGCSISSGIMTARSTPCSCAGRPRTRPRPRRNWPTSMPRSRNSIISAIPRFALPPAMASTASASSTKARLIPRSICCHSRIARRTPWKPRCRTWAATCSTN